MVLNYTLKTVMMKLTQILKKIRTVKALNTLKEPVRVK